MDLLPSSAPLPIPLDQLERYVARECTDAERREVETALEMSPALGRVLAELGERVLPREARAQAWDADTALVALRVRIADEASHTSLARSESARSDLRTARRMYRWWGLATIGVGLLVLGGLFANHAPRSRDDSAPKIYQTGFGQHRRVQLSDGSIMLLAPATTARVQSDRITLSGEAHFTVQSKPGRAFVVHTRNTVVRVLGTAFSVRQYADEPISQIVVAEGKVSVQGQQRPGVRAASTILAARMLAQVSDSGIAVSSDIAVDEYTSGARGILNFNGVPLDVAVKELSRTYGADIRVADSGLAKQRMRMEIPVSDMSLDRVLDLIGKVTDSHYTRDGRAYVISSGRLPTSAPDLVPTRRASPQLEQQYGR